MEAASPVRQATSSSVRAALRISTCPRKPSSSMPGVDRKDQDLQATTHLLRGHALLPHTISPLVWLFLFLAVNNHTRVYEHIKV